MLIIDTGYADKLRGYLQGVEGAIPSPHLDSFLRLRAQLEQNECEETLLLFVMDFLKRYILKSSVSSKNERFFEEEEQKRKEEQYMNEMIDLIDEILLQPPLVEKRRYNEIRR